MIRLVLLFTICFYFQFKPCHAQVRILSGAHLYGKQTLYGKQNFSKPSYYLTFGFNLNAEMQWGEIGVKGYSDLSPIHFANISEFVAHEEYYEESYIGGELTYYLKKNRKGVFVSLGAGAIVESSKTILKLQYFDFTSLVEHTRFAPSLAISPGLGYSFFLGKFGKIKLASNYLYNRRNFQIVSSKIAAGNYSAIGLGLEFLIYW